MAEGAPLLREYTLIAYRGFESLLLRHPNKRAPIGRLFCLGFEGVMRTRWFGKTLRNAEFRRDAFGLIKRKAFGTECLRREAPPGPEGLQSVGRNPSFMVFLKTPPTRDDYGLTARSISAPVYIVRPMSLTR